MNRCFSRLFLSFIFLLLYFSGASAQGPAANGNGKQLPKYMVNPEALNTPQFKAMVEEAEGFLNNLSEEEMKEFMGFYEEFLKGVESGEIDLNEYLPEGILQPLTPEQAEALIAEEQAPAPTPIPTPAPAAPITAIEDVNDAIAMLNAIIERINNIFSKAESDPTISDSLTPWKERLHKLVVYLQLLSKKKHIQRLFTDAEHKSVLEILKELNQQLAIYEPQITVPEFGLGVLQKQEKEVSKRALQKAIESISNAMTTKDLIQKIEKIFAQYEPEALKKAQEMLAAQERAKRPIPTSVPGTLAPTSIETKVETRRGGRDRYESSFEMPEYYGGAGRREQPSFWGAEEPGFKPEGPKGGPGGAVTGGKPAKKTPEEEKKEKEKADKEAKDKKTKDTKDKGKKPAPSSKEAEKIVSDIEKRVDTILDELPEKKDLAEFVTDLLDQNKLSRSMDKLTKINDELGNINRKNGQFKALSKESKGEEAAAQHTKLLQKLSSKLSPVYTEFKGVELPKKLDTPQAQIIDTFIKTSELVFPNFRSTIQPTTKRKMKPSKKMAAEAAETEEPTEEEIESLMEEAPVIAPVAVPAKATVATTPVVPMQAEYTIRKGTMPQPQTAEYVPTAPGMPITPAEFDWTDVD